MLWLATWKQSHHFYADFCLLIQKSIDTSTDGRVCHILSMTQPLLQTWLYNRCVLLAQECCKTLDIFEPTLASSKRNLHKSPRKDSLVQHMRLPGGPYASNGFQRKLKAPLIIYIQLSMVINDQQCFCWVHFDTFHWFHFLTWMTEYWYL